MTRKDFKAIAEIMRKANEDWRGGTPADALLAQIESNLADYLATTNPNFDYARFIEACQSD